MIPADGFNDTADIIWGGEDLTMNVRSNAEKRSKDILLRSKKIAILLIENVEKDKDRQSYIELMIVENCNNLIGQLNKKTTWKPSSF